ncbi:MAG: hypothetical protein KGH56_00600 [Patescibacteria group bacterium]|nr:hypothetical protein [Patescibacteria group bacterium]
MPENADTAKNVLNTRTIAAIVVVIVVIALAAWYAWPAPQQQSAQTAGELNAALEQVQSASSVSVPATSNPLKQATPAVNPIDVTNPFNSPAASSGAANHAYQNPFQ